MRKNIVIAPSIVIVIVAAVAAYFLLQKPSFTISVTPATVTIARGMSENVTFSYNPKVPSNLRTGSSISGPGTGVQLMPVTPPSPFTFTIVVSENAALGTYTVTLEATDGDTGARATTTFTVIVTAPSFTISVSPSTLTIARGGSDNITFSYDPKVPSNLSMGIVPQGIELPPGSEIGEWVNPPFTFRVIVPENIEPGTYEVNVEATDMDTGAKATTTFTLIVT